MRGMMLNHLQSKNNIFSLTPLLPRERLSESSDSVARHAGPEINWITPQHESPDVIDISDASGVLSVIYTQPGLRIGDCLYMQ